MTKYIFTKHKDPNNDYDVSSVTMTVEAETISEIMEEFKGFLVASGFSEALVKRSFGIDEEE